MLSSWERFGRRVKSFDSAPTPSSSPRPPCPFPAVVVPWRAPVESRNMALGAI
uniref:Uncharacterized protein n=1 Tax=Mus musculus TaxID=10090 RepID=Q3V2Z3_MOUSE|nr:unnamed protein product [Mus musculus]